MLLNTKQVAAKFNVGRSTIDRWVKARKIPYLNVNGIVRFEERAIDQWIDKRKVSIKQTA